MTIMHTCVGEHAHHFVIVADQSRLVEYCVIKRHHEVREDLREWLASSVPRSSYAWYELEARNAEGPGDRCGYGMLLAIDSDEYATLFKLTWG